MRQSLISATSEVIDIKLGCDLRCQVSSHFGDLLLILQVRKLKTKVRMKYSRYYKISTGAQVVTPGIVIYWGREFDSHLWKSVN